VTRRMVQRAALETSASGGRAELELASEDGAVVVRIAIESNRTDDVRAAFGVVVRAFAVAAAGERT